MGRTPSMVLLLAVTLAVTQGYVFRDQEMAYDPEEESSLQGQIDGWTDDSVDNQDLLFADEFNIGNAIELYEDPFEEDEFEMWEDQMSYVQGGSCKCDKKSLSCSCCKKVKVGKKISMNLCATISYDKQKKVVSLKGTANGKKIIDIKVPVDKPKPICVKIPLAKLVKAKLCVSLVNLKIGQDGLSGCVQANVKAKVGTVKAKLGCFKIPFKGPETFGYLPSNWLDWDMY